MDEGFKIRVTSLPPQTAYRVGLVAIVGAALYGVGDLAATFPILGSVIWMAIGLSLPAACVIGVLHSRGDQRVFFVGALFPAALTLAVAVTLFVVMAFEYDDIEHFDFTQICLPIAWILTVGCGTLATRVARSLTNANMQEAARGFHTDESTESTRFFWQFSLWSLMATMTLCAVVCAIVFVLPPAFSVLSCLILWAVAPVFVTTVLIFGSAKRRDFWIGAAFPTAIGFAVVTCVFVIMAVDDGPWYFRDDDLAIGLQILTVVLAGSILLLGKLAALLGRRLRSLQDK